MAFRPVVKVFALLAGSALAGACNSGVPHPRSGPAQPTSALVGVDFPPPPARVEFVPKRPSANAVWVNGEWLWQGRRWAWRPGAWTVPPEGAAYGARVVVRRDDGKLFFAPGTWQSADGGEVSAPAPGVARFRSGAVVNPEGETEPTGTDVLPDAGADGATNLDSPMQRRDR